MVTAAGMVVKAQRRPVNPAVLEKERLHGHFFGAGDLEDAVRHLAVRILDEGFVGRIIDDEGPVAAGIVHPGSQGIPVQHRARGIVGLAQHHGIQAGLNAL